MNRHFFDEYAYEIYEQKAFYRLEAFYEDVNNNKDELSDKTDDEILDIAIQCGIELNEVTEHFPAYDVALKLKNNNWIPTPKQRQAIINVTAFYLTQQEYGEV